MLGGSIERVAAGVEIDEWQAFPSPNRQLFPYTPFPLDTSLSSSSYPDDSVAGVLRWCLPPGTGASLGKRWFKSNDFWPIGGSEWPLVAGPVIFLRSIEASWRLSSASNDDDALKSCNAPHR